MNKNYVDFVNDIVEENKKDKESKGVDTNGKPDRREEQFTE